MAIRQGFEGLPISFAKGLKFGLVKELAGVPRIRCT